MQRSNASMRSAMTKRLILLAFLLSPDICVAAADFVPTQSNETGNETHVRQFGATIGTDTADAGSTDLNIIAAGHVAKRGDIIRFTTAGANYMVEGHVASTTLDIITLTRSIPAAPNPGDAFTVLRLLTPGMDTTGAISTTGGGGGGGDATAANQVTGNNSLASIDAKLTAPISAKAVGHTYADSVRNDYSIVNVTTGAWVELITSTLFAITRLYVFDSCGQTLELGTGPAASESRVAIIPPGGLDAALELAIAPATRLSVRAISANCTVGELDITGLN